MIPKLKIKPLRINNSLTQEQVANKLNIKRKTYSDYETNRTTIPISILIKLANLYHVNVGYLCGITNIKDPYPNPIPYRKENLKEIFKNLRIEYGYTQKQLAKLLICEHNTISQYETGKRTIPLEVLISLTKIYSLPLDYIIGITEIKKEVPL